MLRVNEYDVVVESYKESKTLPFRTLLERHGMLNLVFKNNLAFKKSLKGLSVIDLACGEGIYSCLLKKELEADTVVGIDISAEMINLALDANCQHPLGCKYEICDAAVVPCYHNGRYDLVLGMYLLNYASCREQLYRFAQQAFKLLKPGGRFIGYNNYPGDDPQKFSKYRKYGFEKRGSSTQKKEMPSST